MKYWIRVIAGLLRACWVFALVLTVFKAMGWLDWSWWVCLVPLAPIFIVGLIIGVVLLMDKFRVPRI